MAILSNVGFPSYENSIRKSAKNAFGGLYSENSFERILGDNNQPDYV
jgi:hypothetical protein